MSQYGNRFDTLAEEWRVIENAHDRQHPNRDQCGGVGGCSLMFAASELESEMVEALNEWRKRSRA